MSYHLDDRLRRGDVIAYLKSLAPEPHAEAAAPAGPPKL